jgi:Ni/Fe-hydrogenase 1 B-type cytochrome subunit
MPRLFEEVYVYEAPVRAFHWINVLCVVTLFTTGLIIGNPPVFLEHNEAAFGYWFGTVRFIHFATAYIFVCNIAIRLYWAFRGNRFANWRHYLPLHREQWAELGEMVRRYLLIGRNRVPVGANALAALTYALMFLVVLFMIVSGFGMFAAASDGWFPHLFTWIVPLMGGPAQVRSWHHALAWVFPVFAILHVYLVYFSDRASHGGFISTIVSGWRRVESR